ncbi:MAG: dienelactone hydrolase family protein [Immundisolibacteraceae bacterium]|nr:dienelactone hydrolase family protein [Immundisolibacteraceae bacterium]
MVFFLNFPEEVQIMANVEQVTITSADGQYGGYCADGAADAANPIGLVVIQEIFGVNSHIRDVCDRFASEGFTALAPDLFHRQQPGVELGYEEADIGTGFGLKQGLDPTGAMTDLAGAIEFLRQRGCRKIGVVGFCMGGLYTYLTAAQLKVDAAVAYYGGGIGECLDQASQISCPIIFHFGERDQHIPLTVVADVQGAVAKLDNTAVYIYPADHGFNCDQRGSYDADSAAVAWQRSVQFLQQHLV